MAVEVCETTLKALGIWQLNLLLVYATMHLESESRSNQDGQIWFEARLTTLDVEELLSTQIGTKASLGNCVVRPRHSHTGCDDGVTSVSNICEWSTVNNHWMVLGGLNEVWMDGILEQSHHRASHTKVLNGEWGVIVAHTKHNATNASIEVVDVACETQDCHNLRCRGDIEASLGRYSVDRATKSRHDKSQRAVVDVEHTTPHHLLQAYLLRAVVVEIVVEQSGNKVVSRGDGVEVASEVEVDILRRQYLGVTASSSTTLHTEARAQRRLTQSDDGTLADAIESHTKTNADGGLTHTSLGGCDGGNEDEVALAHLLVVDELVRNLCDVLTIVAQLLLWESHLGSNLADVLQFDRTSNFDIRFHNS